jgi:hypothetical protein
MNEDVEIFRREVLGVVSQYNLFIYFRRKLISNVSYFSAITAKEAATPRKAAFLVAIFTVAGTAITLLFAPGHPPILFPLRIAPFFYSSHPAFNLWKVSFEVVKQRYHTEYGQLGILCMPTLEEALEVSDAFRVRSLAMHLSIVVCAVLALIGPKWMLC